MPEEPAAEKPEETIKDTPMEAESERAAQIKRDLEEEMEPMVDEDLFSIQEQEDIQAALELSRADQSCQEGSAPGAKNRRLAEAQDLTGSELAAKAMEDLEAARKELEAKPGSADPAAAISASSASSSAGPAGSASLDNVGQSNSSSQGAAPASG